MNKPARIEGARRPTNVSLSAELVEEAKRLGVNLSLACERGLADHVKKAREAQWLEDNLPALEQWNVWIEKNGLPLAKYRQF